VLRKKIKTILKEEFDDSWINNIKGWIEFEYLNPGDDVLITEFPHEDYVMSVMGGDFCSGKVNFIVGGRYTVLDVDSLFRKDVDCSACWDYGYDCEEKVPSILLYDEETEDEFWFTEDMIRLTYYTNINESEHEWIDNIKPFKYRFFDIYVCNDELTDTDCNDGYSIYIKLPENEVSGIWDGYVVGSVVSGIRLNPFKDYLYKNGLIKPHEYDVIEFIQELDYEEFSMMTDDEIDEFGDYGYRIDENDEFNWLDDDITFGLSELYVGDVVTPHCLKERKYMVMDSITTDKLQKVYELISFGDDGTVVAGVKMETDTGIGDNCRFTLHHRDPKNLNLKD
jgi:hypothetical protein